MPICIHCATPIESLYMRYGKDHIVLSPCPSPICSPRCLGESDTSPSTAESFNVADEYLEHDLTVVIIDLILAKPQAYRHLLFNRASIFSTAAPLPKSASRTGTGTMTTQDGGSKWRRELWTVVKRFLALSLVDAYIRWFYLCVQASPFSSGPQQFEMEGAGRLSSRLWRLVQEHLPMQAGIFFPSLFTPRASNTEAVFWGAGERQGEKPIRAVCSSTPIWSTMSITISNGESADAMLPTLVSYVNVLVVTLIEGVALHICVSLLTWFAVRRMMAKQQQERSSKHTASAAPTVVKDPALTMSTTTSVRPNTTNLLNRTTCSSNLPPSTIPHPATRATSSPMILTHDHTFHDPFLGCKALLLSQLSPLILLTFVLLWSTKFPHPHPNPDENAKNTGLDRHWMVWLIRTFLASLNAGVAIATVLPPNPHSSNTSSVKRTKHALWWPPLILGSAWSFQALVSLLLYTCLS